MALQFKEIATNIAALGPITAANEQNNVTILDLDKVPNQFEDRTVPVMYPSPTDFVSNFDYQKDTFGPGSTASVTVTYNLLYRYLHSQIGTERILGDHLQDMVDNLGLILDALMAANCTVSGAIEFYPADVTSFGNFEDPSGQMFFGFEILLFVKEFVN